MKQNPFNLNSDKNPFDEFKSNENQPKEIQKAEIFGVLKNGSNSMMIKKTGSEIKNQIKKSILPFLNTKKDEIQKLLADFILSATVLPTKPCWMRVEMDKTEFPYKQYTWEEINWSEKAFGQVFKGFGEIEEDCCCCGDAIENTEAPINPCCPQSKEESKARRMYNDSVEDFRDIIMDIKTANVLISNLKDKEEYYLSLEQLVCLNFEKK